MTVGEAQGGDDIALAAARTLVSYGIPVFAAPPALNEQGDWDPRGGTGRTGYWLPTAWSRTLPTPAWLDSTAPGLSAKAWRPGWALCALMGCGLDLLDVDPRNGGDATRKALIEAGMWPHSYAAAVTPSGGTHDFVASLHTGSRDGLRPGLDLKSGLPSGAGRGFAFIAPTVRLSKTTGELASYRWTSLPDLDVLRDRKDHSGARLAELVHEGRGSRPPQGGLHSGPAQDRAECGEHRGHIPEGQRHTALVSYAGSPRRRGVWLDEALVLMQRRWQECSQPPAAATSLPWGDAELALRDVYRRYQAQLTPEQSVTRTAQLAEQLGQDLSRYSEELRSDPGLAAAVVAQLRQRRAREIVVEVEERRRPKPAPDAGTLRELLARPALPSWRIEGLLPASGRLLWSAQRKIGNLSVVGSSPTRPTTRQNTSSQSCTPLVQQSSLYEWRPARKHRHSTT